MTLQNIRDRYTRVKKIGKKWNTYFRVDHQEFCVVEQTSYKRARWFRKMLAIAINRMLNGEFKP